MKETSVDPALYRPCVGIMMVNGAHHVFAGRRSDLPEQAPFCWQMPQGGIEEGETPWSAALRELKEEVGTQNVSFIAESQNWYFYDFPTWLEKPLFENQDQSSQPYQGQRQKWFMVRLIDQDEHLDLGVDLEEKEFSDWRWVPVHDLLSLVVPFKKEVYRNIIQEFAPYFPSFKPEAL